MKNEEPIPKLPPAQNEPLFLHVPLDGQGKGDGAADVKVRHRPFFWVPLRSLIYLYRSRVVRRGRCFERLLVVD